MRIFLSEFVCGGALSGQPLPPSLRAEGEAMWRAILADFAALPGCEVVTTCDSRLIPPVGAQVVRIDAAAEEQAAFERLSRESDAAYVIAPELDGLLRDRCESMASVSRRPLNSTPAVTALCSDKFSLARHLDRERITTIPTDLLNEAGAVIAPERLRFPCVVKPRFGAGSQSIFLCRSPVELDEHRREYDVPRPEMQAIVQPFVAGRTLSVAAFVDSATAEPALILPPAEQRLSTDGRFRYLGGAISKPGNSGLSDEQIADLQGLVAVTCRTIPGLRGYAGFDLLLTEESPARLVLVEINPRLTTSYLGYRRLARGNLAAGLLDPNSVAGMTCTPGECRFSPDGSATMIAS